MIHNFTYKKAFTLTELVVSVVVLGVISGILIPNVLNAANNNSKKAVFKETYSTLQASFIQAEAEGVQLNSSSSIENWLVSHMNTTQDCPASTTKDQCVFKVGTTEVSASNAHRKYKLHSGALIWAYDWYGLNSSRRTPNVLIDWNGSENGSNAIGDDIGAVVFNNGIIDEASLALLMDAADTPPRVNELRFVSAGSYKNLRDELFN